jgi:hypothetical protein
MDPRRREIRDPDPCRKLAALLIVAVLGSGAVYAAGLIALTNLIGRV